MTVKRIAVICGWMDAPSRPVTKYAQLYKRLGYDSVVLLSTKADFLKHEKLVHATTTLESVDARTKVELIPHMLSNGGCRSWYCFEEHLRARQQPYSVPAMVFDSAPYSPRLGALAFTWRGAPFLPTLWDCVAMRAFMVALGSYPVLTNSTDAFTLMWQRFFREQASIPKLFLYSSADRVISAVDVEAAITEARNHGGVVEQLDFERSPHVAHLAYDPERYINVLGTFLTKHVSEYCGE
ncbi:indole-diterpene biosynthesis protein PaxU [Achlya hypogyna]|uniref:Indole-diterpene biosynthesis protein PaxU n=1 Tax=Achlya hypogyna TaxID=1202772 RepID=A0A1V9ZLM1_ACHHY|nr:indole-diterpene biosynthesis protein PaxU [Achlya hypogyna]